MLHFVNGSVVANALRDGGVAGQIVEAADVLHEGPCLPGVYGEDWVKERARYLAHRGYADEPRALASLGRCVDAVAAAPAEREIVLWYEHDLFDQLLLAWLIDALTVAGVDYRQIRLVVVGDHPEVERFHGLGQLSAGQLAALLPSRLPLTDAQRDAALASWRAVCGPDPSDLERMAGVADCPLPWMPGALARLLEEFPATDDGLSRTERQGLGAVADGAPTLAAAFRRSSEQEERLFLGDLPFAEAMNGLARGAAPLLIVDGVDRHSLRRAAAVTDAGSAVLAGAADHAALNGVDRWIGGVHLSGRAPAWRWDRQRSRLVDTRHDALNRRDPDY
jgi:Domain of unknown function (DUF1835)